MKFFLRNSGSQKLAVIASIFLTLSLAVTSCGSEHFDVTLRRYGGFSGIEEDYQVDQSGTGTHVTRMPVDSETRTETHALDPKLVRSISDLIHDRQNDFAAIALSSTGNMTSGISISYKGFHHKMTWPNIDPPHLEIPVLDSLYHLMLTAEQEMTRK